MLGVVTEATLKLLPLPPWRSVLSIGLPTLRAAAALIRGVFRAGFLPSALEVADGFTLAAVRRKFGAHRFAGAEAHVIIELDGQRRAVASDMRVLRNEVRRHRPAFVDLAEGDPACERVWQLRREYSYALRDTGLTKLNEDVVVPRGSLEALFALGAALQRQFAVTVACFGHAGDGNIHVNLMVDEADPAARGRADAALDALFRGVVGLGGSITGEHGIGLAKHRWWTWGVDAPARDLHHTIKDALDPRGILNPGKFLS